jgi:hypothetical protein
MEPEQVEIIASELSLRFGLLAEDFHRRTQHRLSMVGFSYSSDGKAEPHIVILAPPHHRDAST